MVRFQVLQPENLAQACSFLFNHQEDAKIIAGGQNLLVLLKHNLITPQYIIDIKNLRELEYIRNGERSLKIGAVTTHRSLETSTLAKERYPILVEMEQGIGCIQTRNWGTLGGNLCQASPTLDPAPVLIALGAKVTAVSNRGTREISLDNFFVGYLKTALKSDEILAEIDVPALPPRAGVAYHKETIRLNDTPIASVASLAALNEHLKVTDIRIVLQAVGITPLRAGKAEKLIMGESIQDELLEEVATLAAKEAQPISDVYGSEWYKRKVVKVLTRRVVREAIERAMRSEAV